MVGKILSHNFTTRAFKAGEVLEYGQAVYLDGDTVKKITDATKPILGFVARTEHDRTTNIPSGDTVHVLTDGEITLKTAAGYTVAGATIYNVNGTLAATGLKLYGVQAISKIADTEAHVRVANAISVTT